MLSQKRLKRFGPVQPSHVPGSAIDRSTSQSNYAHPNGQALRPFFIRPQAAPCSRSSHRFREACEQLRRSRPPSVRAALRRLRKVRRRPLILAIPRAVSQRRIRKDQPHELTGGITFVFWFFEQLEQNRFSNVRPKPNQRLHIPVGPSHASAVRFRAALACDYRPQPFLQRSISARMSLWICAASSPVPHAPTQ